MQPSPRSLSLRARIFISTGLLVGVCCVASGIGWFGQSSLLSNIDQYEQSEEVSSQVREIDRNVQELKAKSETYLHSGMESTRRAADRLLQQLAAQIARTRQLSGSQEFADLLGEMSLRLETFGQRLELAAQERAIRTSLVNQELPRQADQVEAAIGRLERAIGLSAAADSSAQLLELVQSFDDAQTHLLRYLIDPGADQLDLMLAQLRHAERRARLLEQADTAAIRREARLLSQKLTEFQRLSLRAVQATRGYLYYSNVVMAGEISEFVYYSNQIKQFVNRQQQLNRLARSTAANRTRTLTVVASLASLLCAGLLATGLSYSIVHPISLLTDAFHCLARGETIDDIPGASRRDEIGRMSRAARVFSDKNQETQDLLLRSQSLSAELAAKAKALEETNLELDNFAYVASHDLKAPLRGIHSLAQWVQEDCDHLLPEDSRQHLAQMQDRVEKMNTLLVDLLEYSRVGRLEQNIERVDLQEVVRSVIDMADNRNGIKIQVVTPLPSLYTVLAPLKQVILNLITNAIKYNDKGDQGTIMISCHDLGDRLQISVADNGIGIEPRYHQRVFQMYQRIAPSHIEGSGMGLAIVKKQVEYHGGQVTLESTVGNGSSFTFTWPKQTPQIDETDQGDLDRQLHCAGSLGV